MYSVRGGPREGLQRKEEPAGDESGREGGLRMLFEGAQGAAGGF